MALIHADFPSGFSGLYGGTASYMLNGVYAETADISLPTDPDGVSGGKVLLVDGNNANQTDGLRFVLPTNQDTIGISMRVWFASLPTGAAGLPIPMIWRNASNNAIACVTVTSTGRLEFRNGDYNGSVLQTTTNPAITANGWFHLEGLFNTDLDTFELRVEGIPVLEVSGTAFTGPVSQIFFGVRTTATGATHPYYIKDLVVYDGSGSLNNDFLGSVIVYPLLTNGDVSLNWSVSTGSTGYDLLDESPPDDADYIYAPDPAPAAAVMSLTNLPDDVTSVKGIISYVRAWKTDGGDGNLQVSIKSGASTGLGSDRPITVAATYWFDVFETDPDTSAAWTPSGLDAANIQFDRTV